MKKDEIARMMGDEPPPDPLWLRLAWVALIGFYAAYFITM